MATSGKVPFFGFLAAIRNRVWFGFGAGPATASGGQPIIEMRARSTRIQVMQARSTRVVAMDAASTRIHTMRARF